MKRLEWLSTRHGPSGLGGFHLPPELDETIPMVVSCKLEVTEAVCKDLMDRGVRSMEEGGGYQYQPNDGLVPVFPACTIRR